MACGLACCRRLVELRSGQGMHLPLPQPPLAHMGLPQPSWGLCQSTVQAAASSCPELGAAKSCDSSPALLHGMNLGGGLVSEQAHTKGEELHIVH